MRLGLANAVSAAAGGITSGINIGASVANRAFGGHSWVSVVVNAALLLATLLVLLPYRGTCRALCFPPRSWLSLSSTSTRGASRPTVRLFKGGTAATSALALDLAVALVVSILSIAVNIVLAVFLGLALAVLLFVLRMSRSNIRRVFRGDTVRSRKARSTAEMKILEAKGSSILILELQGALFFGSAERLAQMIEAEANNATQSLILDLRRVTEIEFDGCAHRRRDRR